MARVYSERFILWQSVALETRQYTVPAGHRAVVRQVTVNNASSGVATLFVAVASYYVFRIDLPAPPAARTEEVRWTLYAGEALICQASATNMRVQLDGFLFDDVAGGMLAAGSMPALPPDDPEAAK